MALGSWRFFFAMLVAISHLWENMIHGPAAYAVWGFFLISGYLMTLGMSTRYSDGWLGLRDYAINRFLRIYPAYYIACLLGFVALILLPRYGVNPAQLNSQFVMPQHWRDWATNLGLLPVWGAGNLLVPVSGALGVEVGVYMLIPLMARSPAVAALGFVMSAMLNWQFGIQAESFPLRYSGFLTCFVAFASGALVAHYRSALRRWQAPRLSSVAWVSHCSVWLFWDRWPWTWGLYVSLSLTAWIVISFAERKSTRMDRWFGDLSYPIYLFHTAMAAWWLGYFNMHRSAGFLFAGLSGTLMVSFIVVRLIDRPLEQRFKRRTSKPQ